MSQKARHRLTGRHNSVLGGVSRDQTREYNVVLDVTEDTSIAFRREAECSHLYWDGTGEEPDISQLNNKEWYLDTVSVGRKKNAPRPANGAQ